ncbi:MAG: dihydropteroate synthase, partial [Cyclobacteriaceae bacterium]|nr:dihydropteroate synthase [Cyclobacteriaceae bacterium]
MVKDIFSAKKTLNLRGELLNLDTPKVMGILNVTPDSFFDGGKYLVEDRIVKRIQVLYEDGADIIDIGGYSTRPGAGEISVEEEINRIKNAIELVTKHHPKASISIDTFRSEVAQVALDNGVSMVNDISGGIMDSKMFETVAKYQVPIILMHMRGTPSTMQSMTNYSNLVIELVDELRR